jgi:hypothetical protein
MIKISSFIPELLPSGARWEYEVALPIVTIALHRLPFYWPKENLLSTGVGPLLLRA